jgi:lysophospholipase L1-like esterase
MVETQVVDLARRPVTVLALLALGVTAAAAQARAAAGTSVAEEGPVRILALGDSYTIGEGVTPEERWPAQLAAALAAGGTAAGELRVVARTGWTTDELAAAIAAAGLAPGYDLVSLLVGVNDQYRGRPAAEYPGRFRELLREAIGFAGGRPARVLVLSIPDWGVTPFAAGRDRPRIAAEIDAYNAVNRAEAEAAGARWVDVTAVSREAAADGGLLAADGLHPSEAMYARWVELVLPQALAALSTSR